VEEGPLMTGLGWILEAVGEREWAKMAKERRKMRVGCYEVEGLGGPLGDGNRDSRRMLEMVRSWSSSGARSIFWGTRAGEVGIKIEF